MEHGMPIAPKALRRPRSTVVSALPATVLSFVLALVASLVFGAAMSACSSSSAASCTSAGCPKGDACIDDGDGPRCLRVCTSQSQCTGGTFCNDGQPQSWCVASTLEVTRGTGQWSTSCSPTGGMNDNPACDSADNFLCYGASPTDATAFCTYFDCLYDGDCPGGWSCATINEAPNVDTVSRSFGATRTACLPRQYCASCKLDHDCSPAPDGSQEHCVGQGTPGGGFCAPQCATSSDCALDATCAPQWGVCAALRCTADADCQANGSAQVCVAGACQRTCSADSDCPASNGMPQHCAVGSTGKACAAQACSSDDDCPPTLGTFQHCNAGGCTPECGSDADCDPGANDQVCIPLSVCTPRAGSCEGSGLFCSPCRSDADCAAGGGFCVVSTYSKERFCSQPVQNGTCSSTTGPPPGGCPSIPTGASAQVVACTSTVTDFAPTNQCIGEVTFGTAQGMTQFDPGCWAQNR
jgi:hypothetical protein